MIGRSLPAFTLLIVAPITLAQLHAAYRSNRQLRVNWESVENVQHYEVRMHAFMYNTQLCTGNDQRAC